MRLLTYSILMALLTACGEVSYKRGGSQQDIDRAHQACRGSGEQLAACLSEHGWQKPQVDAFDPLFATVETRDPHEEVISKPRGSLLISPEETAPAQAPVVAKTPQTTPAATSTPPAGKTTATIVQSEPTVAEAAPPIHSTVNDGPDVTYSINSWWKMGAFPEQLKRDQTACERKLGPEYLPDYKTQTFKRAFVACMHDAGWKAVRNLK